MKAHIVIGLGFGDEGKGITTDYLCSKAEASPIVIRFSGGQQAGHCVMLEDGKKHVHSSFGSGTLRGVPSFFSEHCTIYPPNMLAEFEILKKKGVRPELYIHPLTRVTTPYDVWYNRFAEQTNKHGSCGLGVGQTMKRHETSGYKLYAVDLTNRGVLDAKLRRIEKYYSSTVMYDKDGWLLEELMKFHEALKTPMYSLVDYKELFDYGSLIFEGSQGIMLDMDHGIFPNVTYANTTSKNALEICGKLGIKFPSIYYVTRCYQTRHGVGWMSNHQKVELVNNEEEINVFNKYQEYFKVAEIDYDLLTYALEIDLAYSEGIKATRNLVITCNDQRPNFRFDIKRFKPYASHALMSYSPYSSSFKSVKI